MECVRLLFTVTGKDELRGACALRVEKEVENGSRRGVHIMTVTPYLHSFNCYLLDQVISLLVTTQIDRGKKKQSLTLRILPK